MNRKIILSLLLLLPATYGMGQPSENYARRVNTLMGTTGMGLASGQLYPGATYPFGMVQFTPSYFCKQAGFVVNQLSGAGCEHQGNFPTLPLKGRLTQSPYDLRSMRLPLSDERGHAGLYEVNVQDDLRARLTVTERTGMAQYIFPQGEQRGTVVIGGGVAGTRIETAAVVITSPTGCEGYADGGSFCGAPTPYKVYFVAEFDTPAVETGTWKGNELLPRTTFAEGRDSGIYFTFDVSDRKQVQYKIGISYVSVENARLNLRTENDGWNFDRIQADAEAAWNRQLGKITVDGADPDRLVQFYSHLYHVFIHPNLCNDVNGDYMGADFRVHRTRARQYTSFSNWDTYHTQIQLLAMLDPEVASDVVVSHQQFAEQSGGAWPRWVLANIETGIMQGDPTSILVANAFAFGARNYDPKPILRIMRTTAEQPGARSQSVEARPQLKQYLEKGYCDASLQLEYTSADFAIGRFALAAARDEFASWHYLSQARTWKNLYNPATGWLQSRHADGSWKRQDADWREATYKNYFWMVPYNLRGLIDLMGGNRRAEARLDSLFVRLDAGYGDAWFAAGNEPSFHIPWVYNWTDAPWKTQQTVHRILTQAYSSRIDGLPGNDDLGAMGAWYVFAAIGLYPEIPGVGGFSINTPLFPQITLHLKRGDVLIRGGSEKNPYIRSLRLDGKPYNATWITWEELENGATLEYATSAAPNKAWGRGVEPPSYP